MRIIPVLISLSILGLAPTFVQAYDENLTFHPLLPTEKNEVTTVISFTTGTPCYKVELRDFHLDDKKLAINVYIAPPEPDILCAQVVTQHLLQQKIGKLRAGTYSADLYVNDVLKKQTIFNVSSGDVAILSAGKYTDEQGDANLVGEVQSAAAHPVKNVRIGISFFEAGQVVKKEQIYTTMAMIMPNRTSGFSLAMGDDIRNKEFSANIESYSRVDEPVERALTLVVVETALDSDGYGIITGHVVNGGNRNATQVKIVCAIYDSSGNVIDSIFGYTEPDSISANQTARFNIVTHSKVSQGYTASCNTESIELAVEEVREVPEFPAFAIILTASLGAALAVERFRHKL